MRIAFMANPELINSNHRAYVPAAALAQRGHHVHLEIPETSRQRTDLRVYDAVWIHRLHDEELQRIARRLRETGVALVWDNDDELAEVPGKRTLGALRSQQAFAEVRAMLALVDVVTTTSEVLAERYRELGARDVRIIENFLPDHFLEAERIGHEGVVIGWTAGGEHRADLEQIGLKATLQRLLDTHPDVHVESVGIPLRLSSDRYRNTTFVQFHQLAEKISDFDIGIAPLVDSRFNRARSNVKLKEYAAVGAAWLASPVGPYVGMAEREGGRLVADGGWYEELDRLVLDARARRRLAKRGRRWARTQTISRNAERWEQTLTDAVALAAERPGRRGVAPAAR